MFLYLGLDGFYTYLLFTDGDIRVLNGMNGLWVVYMGYFLCSQFGMDFAAFDVDCGHGSSRAVIFASATT